MAMPITPNDRELISAMVGPDFAAEPSEGFIAEYGVRLGMMSRAGVTQYGLGPVPIMQLLRDFEIETTKPAEPVEVSDWRKVPGGTPIVSEGRNGTFLSIAGEGMLIVNIDGFRANHETAAANVMLKAPLVVGVDDSKFDEDPDYAMSPAAAALVESGKEGAGESSESSEENQDGEESDGTESPATESPATESPATGKLPTATAEQVLQPQGTPGKTDDLFAIWGEVEPNTNVVYLAEDGTPVVATYVDLEGESDIVLLIDGERTVVDASLVSIPQPGAIEETGETEEAA